MSLIKKLVEKDLLEKKEAGALEFEIKNLGKKEEEVIVERGIVPEDVLFKMKSEELGIPLKKVDVESVKANVLEKIPEESVKFYNMVPLSTKNNTLEVGMVYPEDLKSQEALKFLSRQGKFSYKVFLINLTDYKDLLRKYRSLKREVGSALEALEEEEKAEAAKSKKKSESKEERMVEDAPVSKMVSVILRHAVEGSASDIHIEPTEDQLRVRFRLMGKLHSSITLPINVHSAVVARIKILSKMKLDETRKPQDGRFSAAIDDKMIDFRVSTFPTTLGEKVVIRVLDPMSGVRSFEDLGLDGRNLEAVKEAMNRPFGLILVTGPTGSGKTTTLYTMLQALSSEEVNVVTLEDPVEYYLKGVSHSQVRHEIGYTFATGLRHILRQDPDIIMVGEIRDEETAGLAINAALTGHIVLSTLHTNNVLGIIPRLLDIGVQDYLLPSALSCGIAQRLVRRLCPKCRKKVVPEKKLKDVIIKEAGQFPEEEKKKINVSDIHVYEPVGCQYCKQSGYVGRVGIFEVMLIDDRVSGVILEDFSESGLKKAVKEQGMVTMFQDGIIKALQGMATIQDVLRATEED